MANLSDELLALEREFWTGDAEFYRRNLDETCLIAFTAMSGVFGREDIAATIEDDNRWQKLSLAAKGLVEPAPGVALFTYQAEATRANGEPYAALVSSGYVRRDGAWKMIFHQQTPI